jgi:chromosome segregation ATPase
MAIRTTRSALMKAHEPSPERRRLQEAIHKRDQALTAAKATEVALSDIGGKLYKAKSALSQAEGSLDEAVEGDVDNLVRAALGERRRSPAKVKEQISELAETVDRLSKAKAVCVTKLQAANEAVSKARDEVKAAIWEVGKSESDDLVRELFSLRDRFETLKYLFSFVLPPTGAMDNLQCSSPKIDQAQVHEWAEAIAALDRDWSASLPSQ